MNLPTDWGSLGAMLFVLTTVFTVISLLITKMLVMPAIGDSTTKWNEAMKAWTEAADKEYLRRELFNEYRNSIDYLISKHFDQDEKRQEAIEKKMDMMIELITKGK